MKRIAFLSFKKSAKTVWAPLDASHVIDIKIGRHRIREWVAKAYTPMLAKFLPNPVTIGDHIFHYHESSRTSITAYLGEPYERETVAAFRRLVQPGDVVYDLGANIGFFTMEAAQLVGETGHVFAFEPHPDTFGSLQTSVAANGYASRVTLACEAVSDHDGQEILFLSSRGSNAHSLVAKEETPGNSSIEVEVTTLDTHWVKSGAPGVKLVKIDVEGHEHSVLTGMRKLAEASPDLNVVFEYFPKKIEGAIIWDTLSDLGLNHVYSLTSVDDAEPMMSKSQFVDLQVRKYMYINVLASKIAIPTG